LSKIVDEQVQSIDGGYERQVTVSRRKAMVFADAGKVDHEGKFTMYGQIIS